MQIVRREWDISLMAVLFEVEDGQDRFVCSITENGLNPENSHALMVKTIAEAIFDEKIGEIEAAASKVIVDARASGIKHTPGPHNVPLPITLYPNTTAV